MALRKLIYVIVEVVMVVLAKVFRPVKLLVPVRVARFEASERFDEDNPVIVTPVRFRFPVRARLVPVAEVKVRRFVLMLVEVTSMTFRSFRLLMPDT